MPGRRFEVFPNAILKELVAYSLKREPKKLKDFVYTALQEQFEVLPEGPEGKKKLETLINAFAGYSKGQTLVGILPSTPGKESKRVRSFLKKHGFDVVKEDLAHPAIGSFDLIKVPLYQVQDALKALSSYGGPVIHPDWKMMATAGMLDVRSLIGLQKRLQEEGVHARYIGLDKGRIGLAVHANELQKAVRIADTYDVHELRYQRNPYYVTTSTGMVLTGNRNATYDEALTEAGLVQFKMPKRKDGSQAMPSVRYTSRNDLVFGDKIDDDGNVKTLFNNPVEPFTVLRRFVEKWRRSVEAGRDRIAHDYAVQIKKMLYQFSDAGMEPPAYMRRWYSRVKEFFMTGAYARNTGSDEDTCFLAAVFFKRERGIEMTPQEAAQLKAIRSRITSEMIERAKAMMREPQFVQRMLRNPSPQGERLRLREMQEWDFRKGESEVRLLEMMVDSGTRGDVRLSLQFWKDVNTYGLAEAFVYLQGYKDDGLWVGDIGEVKGQVNKLLARHGRVRRFQNNFDPVSAVGYGVVGTLASKATLSLFENPVNGNLPPYEPFAPQVEGGTVVVAGHKQTLMYQLKVALRGLMLEVKHPGMQVTRHTSASAFIKRAFPFIKGRSKKKILAQFEPFVNDVLAGKIPHPNYPEQKDAWKQNIRPASPEPPPHQHPPDFQQNPMRGPWYVNTV